MQPDIVFGLIETGAGNIKFAMIWNINFFDEEKQQYNFKFKNSIKDGQSGTSILQVDTVIETEMKNGKLLTLDTNYEINHLGVVSESGTG